MFAQQTNNVDDKANWPFLEQAIWSTFLGQIFFTFFFLSPFFFFFFSWGSILAAWLYIDVSARGDKKVKEEGGFTDFSTNADTTNHLTYSKPIFVIFILLK